MVDKTISIGTTVSFQDKSNDATITSYTWNFGIGEGTSTLKDDTHTYNNIGLYSVVHTVTNTCGTTTCPIKTIEVVTELPPSGVSSTVMLMGAALIGFMMMSKKK